MRMNDGSDMLCKAAGRLYKKQHKEDALAVGDRVTIELVPSEGAVTGRIIQVAPRISSLSRLDPVVNSTGREIRQVIMANVGLCLFVFACAEPEFSSRQLDRYVVGAEAQKLPLAIIASKVDLVGLEAAHAMFADYEAVGYKVIYSERRDGVFYGIDSIRALMRGKLCVLTGRSGAGKSSLLNGLKPGLAQEVGAVSSTTSKGRHTTVAPELFSLGDDTWLADTPGLRTYQVWDVDAEELDGYYREIAPLVNGCGFSNCSHRHEPNCAVRAAVDSGKISHARWDSYCRLRDELEHARKW